ncbi:hypothetical protein KGO95_03620 [Patescibacteria group bacterium]|nr:hypothetical protein [Patescibacteria group bacterium]
MDGIMVGPSLGYLYGGPDVSGKIDTTSTSPGGPGSSTNKATNNTFRILGEVHKEIAISGPWSADLEAGLGMAVDAETDSCSATGTSVGKAPCSKGPTNGWMTWELSPAIAYKMVSVGVRYAGFARGGFVPWNTFGAFVGARY